MKKILTSKNVLKMVLIASIFFALFFSPIISVVGCNSIQVCENTSIRLVFIANFTLGASLLGYILKKPRVSFVCMVVLALLSLVNLIIDLPSLHIMPWIVTIIYLIICMSLYEYVTYINIDEKKEIKTSVLLTILTLAFVGREIIYNSLLTLESVSSATGISSSAHISNGAFQTFITLTGDFIFLIYLFRIYGANSKKDIDSVQRANYSYLFLNIILLLPLLFSNTIMSKSTQLFPGLSVVFALIMIIITSIAKKKYFAK